MLSQASHDTVMVDYATRDITAQAGMDYSASFGVAVFPPGTTNLEVLVSVNADALNEADETFWLMLTNTVHATLFKDHAIGTIKDDDPPPALSITDAIFLAGENGTNAFFTVNLSAVSGQTITVDYATASGTATSGAEFIPVADTLTFAPGATKQTLSVPVCSDALTQPAGTFFVSLSDAMNATVTRGRGIATILQNRPMLADSTSNSVKSFTSEHGLPTQARTQPSADTPPATGPADGRLEELLFLPAQTKSSSRVLETGKQLGLGNSEKSVMLPGAHLTLGLIAATNFVHVEQDVVLVLTITNHGPDMASGVFLANRIPDSATFLSAQASQGNFSHVKDLLLFDLGTLPGAGRAAVAIAFKLSAAGPATNVAQLSFSPAQIASTNSSSSFVVIATNELPVLLPIDGQFTTENTPTLPIAVTVSDSETPAASLILLASSSDKVLIPDQNLVFGGTAGRRTLIVVPAANQTGSAAITVTATDPNGGEASVEFEVTVTPTPTETLSIERIEGVSQPPGFERIEREGGDIVKLYFYAEGGLPYTVEFNDSLSFGAWQPLTNISALPITTLLEITDKTTSSPQRFYRLNIPAPSQQVVGESIARPLARINLQFSAKAGRSYTIEYCDSLASNSWNVLTRLSPASETSTVTVSDSECSQSGRFYRLRSP